MATSAAAAHVEPMTPEELAIKQNLIARINEIYRKTSELNQGVGIIYTGQTRMSEEIGRLVLPSKLPVAQTDQTGCCNNRVSGVPSAK
jgi:hypothetical protein